LCNTAGSEGISLNATDTIIFLQRPWSRIANEQALNRIYKEGRASYIIDVVTPDTVEERVFESLRDKDEEFEKLVNDRALIKQWLQ